MTVGRQACSKDANLSRTMKKGRPSRAGPFSIIAVAY